MPIPIALLFGLIAIIFAGISLFQIGNYSRKGSGKGMAITGLILGIIIVLISLLLLAGGVGINF